MDAWADTGGPDLPPGKSQVAICFLRNTGAVPFEKQLDPSGPRGPVAFRGLYEIR